MLPGRDAVIFITFVVILSTLVVQGLTLAPLIRVLGIVGGNEEAAEELHARKASVRAGVEALERIPAKGRSATETTAALRKSAATRHESLRGPASAPPAHLPLRLAMIAAAREAVIASRDRNKISDIVMRRLLREFDYEEVLLHQRYGESD